MIKKYILKQQSCGVWTLSVAEMPTNPIHHFTVKKCFFETKTMRGDRTLN